MPGGALAFCLVALASAATARAGASALSEERPVSATAAAPDVELLDFGRVAFGNLKLEGGPGAPVDVVVRFGEALKDGRVDQHPPGSVRYARVVAHVSSPTVVAPPPDPRNTRPPAVLTPPDWGTLIPFRWAELEGGPGALARISAIRRAAYVRGWSDQAATFECSDPALKRIWELSRQTIKATSFAGIFVDGDRERLAYEADAYINQLGYYACGPSDPIIVRATFARLLRYPTWPTEWAPHMVFMAYADWRETADTAWLAAQFEALKGKVLQERAGPDGLVRSTPRQMARGDLVDWPQGERDGYIFTPVNTVVNAFHLRALALMSEMARALGRHGDERYYAAAYARASAAFVRKLFDSRRHLFRDGLGTEHASLHANAFPLAFHLVPEDERASVARWLATRGMACSVYAAQYLLQALFENGQTDAALRLMTAPGDRSWQHMVEAGATLTWEAWDVRYKPNLDWNHAWGSAPVNLLPAYLLGVTAASPGWKQSDIRLPRCRLQQCAGRVPTPLGPIDVAWDRGRGTLHVALPPGMQGRVILPAAGVAGHLTLNGAPCATQRAGEELILSAAVEGVVTVAGISGR